MIFTLILHRVSYVSSRICQSVWFNRFFMIISIANNIYIVLQAEKHILNEASSYDLDVLFACAYLIQTMVMISSLRFGALMRESIFNRLDFIATLTAWIQIAGRKRGLNLTLCSLRLMRLMHPLTRYRAFAVLDAILRTLNNGWASVGTILALLAGSILVLGVVGVYAYAGSFRRRCVWADTLQLKIPEQWCSRYAELGSRALMGLHSNCGPLQVCPGEPEARGGRRTRGVGVDCWVNPCGSAWRNGHYRRTAKPAHRRAAVAAASRPRPHVKRLVAACCGFTVCAPSHG